MARLHRPVVSNAFQNHRASAYAFFDGNYYCQSGPLFPFERALATSANDSRRHKLLDMFDQRSVVHCSVTRANSEMWISLQLERDLDPRKHSSMSRRAPAATTFQTLYVLHDKSVAPTGEMFSWKVRYNAEEVMVTPQLTVRHDLGSKMLSVFRSDRPVTQSPWETPALVCGATRGPESPR